MGNKMRREKTWFIVLICVLTAALTACGGNAAEPSTTPAASTEGAVPEQPAAEATEEPAEEAPDEPAGIDWEARKAANQEAGSIKFMTSFNYSASIANVNAWVAKDQGYFEQLGLDVEVLPGLSSDAVKLLAAGQLQMAHAGSASQIVSAVSNGGEIKGVLAMAPINLNILMSLEESGIKTPKDLEGKTVGYKGAMPAHILAMFQKGGADLSKVKQVSVGYDPTILDTTEVDAITVFKSNEVYQMEKLGYKVSLMDPADYGIITAFGVIGANNDFAEKHPTAVEDFLRAILKAHEWIEANPEETIALLERLAGGNFNKEIETNRLKVETSLIRPAKHDGQGIGWFPAEQWQEEIDILTSTGVLADEITSEEVADNAFISAVYDGDRLIWPE